MADSVALVWDLIARDNASGTFRKVGAEAEGASAGVGKLLGGFTALAVGGAIAASVKAASDFQASMLLVQTQAGSTRAEVAKMSPAILSLAGKVAQAPNELATSLYHVESTGLRGAKALEAVKIAAEGARIGHADLEQTTNALTATIASGMVPATETYAQAMGKLNTIVGSGDMKMQDLNDAMSTGILVTVKQYGVSLNDVGAALADFGDNNIRGADAATRLRMAVQAIASPSVKAGEVLKGIGLSVKQLQSDQETGGLNKAITDLHQHLVDSGVAASKWGTLLTDAFTKKAGAGVLTLIGTFDRFKSKYTEVSKGANSLGDAWAATTKTASFQFAALKDSVDAVGIKLGTALLPALGGFSSWLASVGIPAVEHFWASVQQFGHAGGFQTFLHDVESLGVGAWHAIQQISGVLVDLGRIILPPVLAAGGSLVHLFAELPGPVQLAAAAFIALRIAAGKGMFDGVVSGAGAVRTSFRNFGADVSATRSILEQVHVPMAGFTATLQTTAERGFGAMKSAGQGVMNMLGGPWGAALAGAGLAVGAITARLQESRATEDQWTQAMKDGGQAADDAMMAMARQKATLDANDQGFMGFINKIDGYSAAQRWAAPSTDKATKSFNDWYTSLAGSAKAQEDVTLAMGRYQQMLKDYGPNSFQAKSAADALRVANGMLASSQEQENSAQKTHLQLLQDQRDAEVASVNSSLGATIAQDQLSQAISQYNTDAADGKHTTAQLKDESLALAQQVYQTATQTAQAAADQAKANGVTDTSIVYNNTLHGALDENAKLMAGPGKAAVEQMTTAAGKMTVQHHNLNDAISKLGLNVVSTWDNNTKEVSGATAAQIKTLQGLGLHITQLPGMPGHPANILITADTSPADKTLSAFARKAQQMGFVGALWNLTPSGSGNMPKASGLVGLPPVHRAMGGPISGPGTGTSDSVLIAASNGEHVWTAAETQAAGGHAGVESLRKMVLAAGGGRAAGGPVLSYPVDWNAAAMKQANGYLSQLSAGSAGPIGSGVERWRGTVDAVLRALRQSLSLDNGILSLIQHESGGNPNAINLSDSNARAGHPSQGLMQTIPGTFAAYAGPYAGRGILDPFANIYAGTAYALSRYGAGMLLQGGNHVGGKYVGYKTGTNFVPEDGLKYLHKGEAVVPAKDNYRSGPITVIAQFGTETIEARTVRVVNGRLEDLHRKKRTR